MAVLFVLVLLALVKHVAGMRGSPETASMLETEVNWWKEDPCAQFGAKKKSWWQSNICHCPEELPLPRKCEGRSGRTFDLKETIEFGSNCHCEEDPCAEFGAKVQNHSEDWCQCPKELPLPRNCEGRSKGRTFDLKETLEEGSNCHCEEDPCAEFGAKVDHEDDCICPKDRPVATKECQGGASYFFRLSKATSTCQCETWVKALERLSGKFPVAASALRFCEALAEHGYSESFHIERNMKLTLKKTSPEICQRALVGTITPTEAKRAPWAEKASELSRKGSDEDEDEDRAYGRMRSVKESATTSAEKALWEHALSQVCKDECEDLLHMMKEEARHLAEDVRKNNVPFAQACAEHVVQQVEAEVLGCCGRSCGFDGRRCLLWPFFSPKEKVEWEVECCSEMNVLKDSSRELMCNSVLPDRLAKEASQYDLEEQSGTDVGKVLIGQNTSLFWTEKGAQESALGKEAKAHGGEKVNMEFLLEHKDVGEEYLRLGYFKEEPITKILDEANSMMEVSSQDDTCNFGKFKEKCPKKFMTTFVEKCNEAWNVAEGFRFFLLHPGGGHCTESDSQSFSTPEDCQKLAKNSFGKVFLHYFEYNKENKDLPIKCFSVSKKQCKGKDDWWKRIKGKFMSVQKLMNDKKRDVNDYAQLVYIKSMKTN